MAIDTSREHFVNLKSWERKQNKKEKALKKAEKGTEIGAGARMMHEEQMEHNGDGWQRLGNKGKMPKNFH